MIVSEISLGKLCLYRNISLRTFSNGSKTREGWRKTTRQKWLLKFFGLVCKHAVTEKDWTNPD